MKVINNQRLLSVFYYDEEERLIKNVTDSLGRLGNARNDLTLFDSIHHHYIPDWQ